MTNDAGVKITLAHIIYVYYLSFERYELPKFITFVNSGEE